MPIKLPPINILDPITTPVAASTNKTISDFSATTEILDTDNILIDRPTENNYFKMDGASLKAMFGGDSSLKADRVAADSQQLPLFVAGDGLYKADTSPAEPTFVSGSLSITSNSLIEPTQLKCSFLYVQAGGYIWGLQIDKAPEIPNGFIGELATEITFTRIASIAAYVEEPGFVDIDETIYGDYAAIQNATPIAVEFQLTITSFKPGQNAGVGNITPLLTLDAGNLLNFNYHRVQGVDAGIMPTDAVNFGQHLEIIYAYYLIYNQPTILSAPENPPFSLTSVSINNKPGNITAEVGDAVQFTLPNTGDVFNGVIANMTDPNNLICSWTGYTELPVDDAGTWDKRNVTVDGVVYPSEEFTIATEYAPQFDGNGLNQTGALGNFLVVDKVAQMSFVVNSIIRLGTKVISQYASGGTEIICKLNRALTNTEGLDTDVWYCYDKTNGNPITPSIAGSGDTYTLTFVGTSTDKIICGFLGENLPFVLPE